MAEAKVDDGFHETEVVYLGQRAGLDSKLFEAWIPLKTLKQIGPDEWDLLERMTSHFAVTKKVRVPAIVGGIYSMSCKVEGDSIATARVSTREYLRPLEDAALVARVDGLDSSARMRVKSTKQLAKLKEQHPLMEDLRALQAHYHRLPYQDRMAFELTVLTYIRRRG